MFDRVFYFMPIKSWSIKWFSSFHFVNELPPRCVIFSSECCLICDYYFLVLHRRVRNWNSAVSDTRTSWALSSTTRWRGERRVLLFKARLNAQDALSQRIDFIFALWVRNDLHKSFPVCVSQSDITVFSKSAYRSSEHLFSGKLASHTFNNMQYLVLTMEATSK